MRRARMLLVAVMVLSVVSTILALVVIQRLDTAYAAGLASASDAAAVAGEAATSAAALATDLGRLTASVEQLVAGSRELAATAAAGSADIGEAARTNLASTVEGTATLADRVAGTLEVVERFIPGDTASLAEDARAIADGLAPFPAQLRGLGDDLERAAMDLDALDTSLAALQERLAALGGNVDAAAATVEQVPDLVDDLARTIDRAESRRGVTVWLLRLAVVALGATVFVAAAAGERMLRALPEPTQDTAAR